MLKMPGTWSNSQIFIIHVHALDHIGTLQQGNFLFHSELSGHHRVPSLKTFRWESWLKMSQQCCQITFRKKSVLDFCCSKHLKSTLEALGKQFGVGFSVGFLYQMGLPNSIRPEQKWGTLGSTFLVLGVGSGKVTQLLGENSWFPA